MQFCIITWNYPVKIHPTKNNFIPEIYSPYSFISSNRYNYVSFFHPEHLKIVNNYFINKLVCTCLFRNN